MKAVLLALVSIAMFLGSTGFAMDAKKSEIFSRLRNLDDNIIKFFSSTEGEEGLMPDNSAEATPPAFIKLRCNYINQSVRYAQELISILNELGNDASPREIKSFVRRAQTMIRVALEVGEKDSIYVKSSAVHSMDAYREVPVFNFDGPAAKVLSTVANTLIAVIVPVMGTGEVARNVIDRAKSQNYFFVGTYDEDPKAEFSLATLKELAATLKTYR